MWKRCSNISYFASLLSPFSSPWRLAAVVLVVPSDLLVAECRGRGLHLGGARALQRGRGRGLFHHLPTLLVVPHHGQPAGQSPKLSCPTVTVSENSKHAFCSSIPFSSVRINKHFSQCLLPFNYGPLQFFFLATISFFVFAYFCPLANKSMLQRLCEANIRLLWQPSFDVIIPSLQLGLKTPWTEKAVYTYRWSLKDTHLLCWAQTVEASNYHQRLWTLSLVSRTGRFQWPGLDKRSANSKNTNSLLSTFFHIRMCLHVHEIHHSSSIICCTWCI